MAAVHLVEAAGPVDGSNRDFAAPESYEPNSLRALWNGRLLSRDFEDGYEEVDPTLGTFRLRRAPKVGDNVFVFYEEVV
jgi:hypothetical protein